MVTLVKRVCVIGNFSGRNAGDAAILGGLLKDVTAACGPMIFDVPTINPDFVRRQYSAFDVRPVGLLPWNLSVKIFGVPIVRSILRSDLVLVTDAILFDRKLFNPLFNYLSTLAVVLPMARARRIPTVLYNVSLGPARTRMGRACLHRVLQAADEIILRDSDSLEEIPAGAGLEPRVRSGADCALSTIPPDAEVVDRILLQEDLLAGGRPFLTLNINSYVDVFVRQRGERIGIAEFTAMIAATVRRVLASIDANIVVVVTQPMDLRITQMVLAQVGEKNRIRLVSNLKYSYAELAGIFLRAEMHVGMRTHSLILASSVNTPIVGIIATPKNRGYMRSIRQSERAIEFEDLTSDSLTQRILQTWRDRHAIRQELTPIIASEKQKAASAASYLRPYLVDRANRT